MDNASAPEQKEGVPTPSSGWCVYMLRCGDGSLYSGCTNDLERRLSRHQSGRGAAYTRSRLPVVLVFKEEAADRSGALKREVQLKRLKREEKLLLVKQAGLRGKGRRPRKAQSAEASGKPRRPAAVRRPPRAPG